MSLICIDTQVCIWGIKQQCTPGQEDMIERAQYLFESCDNNKERIVIPSVVVGELLLDDRVDPDKLIPALERHFIIQTYDLAAAKRFAQIWRGRPMGEKSHRSTKTKMRADCMIVATAVACGCNKIYSNDKDLRKFATGYIQAMDLPKPPPQQVSYLDDLDDSA